MAFNYQGLSDLLEKQGYYGAGGGRPTTMQDIAGLLGSTGQAITEPVQAFQQAKQQRLQREAQQRELQPISQRFPGMEIPGVPEGATLPEAGQLSAIKENQAKIQNLQSQTGLHQAQAGAIGNYEFGLLSDPAKKLAASAGYKPGDVLPEHKYRALETAAEQNARIEDQRIRNKEMSQFRQSQQQERQSEFQQRQDINEQQRRRMLSAPFEQAVLKETNPQARKNLQDIVDEIQRTGKVPQTITQGKTFMGMQIPFTATTRIDPRSKWPTLQSILSDKDAPSDIKRKIPRALASGHSPDVVYQNALEDLGQ